MNTGEVDVGDIVIVTKGDWKGQSGRVETRYDPPAILNEKQYSLLTIRLTSFGFGNIIVKRSMDIEKTAPTP